MGGEAVKAYLQGLAKEPDNAGLRAGPHLNSVSERPVSLIYHAVTGRGTDNSHSVRRYQYTFGGIGLAYSDWSEHFDLIPDPILILSALFGFDYTCRLSFLTLYP